MTLTDASKSMLAAQRERQRLKAAGYEEVNESGGRLWELRRGCRMSHVIVDVVIGPEKNSLFIKTAPRQSDQSATSEV